MRRNRIKNFKDAFDTEELKVYMKMPAKDKLQWLEEAYMFLQKFTSRKNKKILEVLKARGF